MNRKGWGMLVLLVVFLGFASLSRLAADCDDKCREVKRYMYWSGGTTAACQGLDVADCYVCTFQAGSKNCVDRGNPLAGRCTGPNAFMQVVRSYDDCVDLCELKATKTYSEAEKGSTTTPGLGVGLFVCYE